jgi:hypothetical protein
MCSYTKQRAVLNWTLLMLKIHHVVKDSHPLRARGRTLSVLAPNLETLTPESATAARISEVTDMKIQVSGLHHLFFRSDY